MKTGRNDPCPCGSGQKAKYCCGTRPAPVSHTVEPLRQSVPSAAGKQRNCDGCNACCGVALVIDDAELVKPKDRVCPHVCAGGCSRWSTRLPKTCREFDCSYLVETGAMPIEARPDHVGAIVRRGVDRVAMLAEYRPNGLARLLADRTWAPVLRNDLAEGWCLRVSFHDDPHDAFAMRVRRSSNGLGVELAACDDGGKPILAQRTAHDGSTLRAAVFVRGQNFAFDARSLIFYLGDRDRAVLSSSRRKSPAAPVRFQIERRQAKVLNLLLQLIGQPVARPAESPVMT